MGRILVLGILFISQWSLFITHTLAGNVMWTECENAIRELEAKKVLTFGTGYCAGFLRGTFDVITAISQANLRPEYRVCSPGTTVNTERLIRAYINYIDRHRQTQQTSSHVTALKAFHSEWPCPETLVIDSQITLIQSYLKKLGYQVGTIDGLLGDKTRGAIKKFQEHNNHPVTGEISVELERALKDTYYKTTEN